MLRSALAATALLCLAGLPVEAALPDHALRRRRSAR